MREPKAERLDDGLLPRTAVVEAAEPRLAVQREEVRTLAGAEGSSRQPLEIRQRPHLLDINPDLERLRQRKRGECSRMRQVERHRWVHEPRFPLLADGESERARIGLREPPE